LGGGKNESLKAQILESRRKRKTKAALSKELMHYIPIIALSILVPFLGRVGNWVQEWHVAGREPSGPEALSNEPTDSILAGLLDPVPGPPTVTPNKE
jgi:hypothetical protein